MSNGRLDTITTLFRIGMWWRIAYGTLKLFLGLALLRVVGSPLSEIFFDLTQHELVEDKNDILIQLLHPLVAHLPFSVTYFIAFHFIFWALIDIFLSIALLKEKLWAFPAGMALISLFVVYEIFRVFHTHSVILLGVIIVDILLIVIIYGEHKKLTKNTTPMFDTSV